MTCKNCHEGALEATQAPQIPAKLRRFASAAGVGAVLVFGGLLGLGLPLMLDRGVDLSWALIGVPVLLLVCTPLLIMVALRLMSEQAIWRCTSCGFSVERS
jgi:hypothetical protein